MILIYPILYFTLHVVLDILFTFLDKRFYCGVRLTFFCLMSICVFVYNWVVCFNCVLKLLCDFLSLWLSFGFIAK